MSQAFDLLRLVSPRDHRISHSRLSCLTLAHPFILQVELKTTPETPDQAYLQKAADFVHAFILGTSALCHILFVSVIDLMIELGEDPGEMQMACMQYRGSNNETLCNARPVLC